MFHDLDDTLKKVLDDPNAPQELVAAEVSFDLPDRDFKPEESTVNLFLYDVHENRVLRDPEPIIEKAGNTYVRRQPPLRVDCSYMVTAWDKGATDVRVVNEHRLLSQALQWFSRFPIIPDRYLTRSLQNPPFPHRTEVALPDGTKNMGEFWTALGRAPRPSFNLLVTIAIDPGVRTEGPLVTTHFSRADAGAGLVDETWVQIGGRVLWPRIATARAQANLSAASGNQATVTNAGDAANFRSGDIVFLRRADGTKSERATVANINGATITLRANLTETYADGTIRIADLIPSQRTIRLVSAIGLAPGASISIAQGATAEPLSIQTVDRVNNFIALAQGLVNTYTMAAINAPVNIEMGIADALVDIIDAGLRTQTDSEGHYSFPRVPVGNRTIRAVAVGFEPMPKPKGVLVPGLPEDYEIILTPL